MSDDRRDDAPSELWTSQPLEGFRMDPHEIRRRSEQLDKNIRRTRIGMYLFCVLVTVLIVAMTLISPNWWQIVGVILTVPGFAWMLKDVRRLRVRPDEVAESGDESSIAFHRTQLGKQLEFTTPYRVWLRAAALMPGPLLFFFGFAIAHPKIAPIMYLQIVMFLLAVLAAVPLARIQRRKIKQRIAGLETLQGDMK